MSKEFQKSSVKEIPLMKFTLNLYQRKVELEEVLLILLDHQSMVDNSCDQIEFLNV